MLGGEPVDLSAAPINWRRPVTPANQVQAGKRAAADADASVVAILKWSNQCPKYAKRLDGLFSSMDELEGKDLLQSAGTLDLAADGSGAAIALIDIARECITRLPSQMGAMLKTLKANKLPRITARTPHRPLVEAVLAVTESPTSTNLLAMAEAIEGISGVFVHRRDLWESVKRSITVQRDEQTTTIREAAVIVRDRTRENGRAVQPRTVSRTVLVKGLEYDHAVILDAHSLDARDFYVAATRGRRTLTVLSDDRVLEFPAPNL